MVPERRGPGKKVKILPGGLILEVREDPGDQITSRRQMLVDAQGPWLVTRAMGDCGQQHNMSHRDFLPSLPRAVAAPRWESQD